MSNNGPAHDQNKLIQWPQHKVRWIIYYYLVGSIVGLYLLFLNDWLFGWAWTWLIKFSFVIFFCPIAVSVLSVILRKKISIRDSAP